MRTNSRGVWIGFGVLCLLAGSRWLVEAAYPSLLPMGPRSALHMGLIAVVLGGVEVARRERWGGWNRVGGWGLLVFALPGAVVVAASGRVAGLSEEVVFLLLPIVTVSVMAQGSGFGRQEQQEDARRLLWPALAGLAGALLLVPFTLPSSFAGQVWLAALVITIVLASWGTVRLHRALQGEGLLSASAAIAAFAAVLAAFSPGWTRVGGLSGSAWLMEGEEALLLDGPLLLLGVWCLRDLSPIRSSARVLLVLLVAIVESFAAVRPALTWTIGAGAALMAVGAGWLLWNGGAE